MKRALKLTTIVIVSVFILFLISLSCIFASYACIAKQEVFDKSRLASSNLKIEIYDTQNNLITDKNLFSNRHIALNTLKEHTKNAFISIEDKNFYTHKGINEKRILKALFKNLISGKVKEGASTISQQLIKNTHLSSEKTISRKIKEIFLAREMEKQISKEDILESYLNVIYFGNNIYGIENASEFYFSKPASELNLPESATLAGLIKSPANYCPITSPDNCKMRRNLVLSEMLKDKKITNEEYENAKNTPLNLNVNENFDSGQNTYSQACINQASKILSLSAKQIALGQYKIYTHQSPEKQKSLENAVNSEQKSINYNNFAAISINNETLGVEAYVGSGTQNVLLAKRQPGSTIKPLLVYGPAMNENLIAPSTKILDDKININGYSPKNVNNTFSGYITVKEAVAKSVNIPAVKTLSYVGIDKAKRYANRLNINFDDKDNGYALALGGMTYGTDLQTLTNAYTTFANNGKFKKASFIKEIRDKNNNVIYTSNQPFDQVFREDSNYLTLSTMFETVKTGTAKRLGGLNYQIASKTGTVGKDENSDAYNISLTTQDTVGVWIGNLKTNNIENITGGIEPTLIVKNYFENIYENATPKDFEIPTSITEIEIDALEYEENHIVVKANDFIPERYKIKEMFSKFNLPLASSNNFVKIEPAELSGKIENGKAVLTFEAKNYLIYDLYKIQNDKPNLIKTFEGKAGPTTYATPLNSKSEKYYLKTKIKNYATGEEIESAPSKVVELIKSGNKTIGGAQNDKWYV